MKILQGLRDDSGFALLLTLWVLTLLTIIVGQFCFSMRTEANLARSFKEAAEAYYVAEAGINWALWELLPETKPPTEEGQGEETEQTDTTVWRVNLPIPPMAFGPGAFTVEIENASGRIDINTADRDLLLLVVDRLEISEDQKETIVDSILDWRDEDELHRLHGAESDYYRGLTPPYHSKNGPFDTLEELLLVQGVTPALFFGHLDQMLTVTPLSLAAPHTIATLRRRPVSGAGVNINAASPVMLAALPEMTPALAQTLMDYRIAAGDFQTLDEVEAIVGTSVFAAMSPYLLFGSVGPVGL